MQQKVTPCLWFRHEAEEAVDFYVSIVPNSRILSVTRHGELGSRMAGLPEGSVMMVLFVLNGQEFLALNGNPMFSPSPALSFILQCDTQEELDRLWEGFSEGARDQQCGWVTDRFGVTWQVVPAVLTRMMQDPDPVKRENLMRALLPMKKLDIETLTRAYEGG